MKRREEGSAHTARLRCTQKDKKVSLPLLHSVIFSYHFVIKRNSFFFFQLKSSEDAPSAALKTAAVRRGRTGRVILHSAGSAEDWHGGAESIPGRLAERRWAARQRGAAAFIPRRCFKVEVDAASPSVILTEDKHEHERSIEKKRLQVLLSPWEGHHPP